MSNFNWGEQARSQWRQIREGEPEAECLAISTQRAMRSYILEPLFKAFVDFLVGLEDVPSQIRLDPQVFMEAAYMASSLAVANQLKPSESGIAK
jgi:hypothetical protein